MTVYISHIYCFSCDPWRGFKSDSFDLSKGVEGGVCWAQHKYNYLFRHLKQFVLPIFADQSKKAEENQSTSITQYTLELIR